MVGCAEGVKCFPKKANCFVMSERYTFCFTKSPLADLHINERIFRVWSLKLSLCMLRNRSSYY